MESLSLELILIVEGNYSRNLGREVPSLDLHFMMGVHIGSRTGWVGERVGIGVGRRLLAESMHEDGARQRPWAWRKLGQNCLG